MRTARAVTTADLDWIGAVLGRRRARLSRLAPVFWRPAPDAGDRHHAFLEYLVTEVGARGWRTEDSVLIAVPRDDGWLIDDADAHGEDWHVLWNAFAAGRGGAAVHLVCPTYEHSRADVAQAAGLRVAESWWLAELSGSGGRAGVSVPLPGATAVTVAAPPVYAPPGPILFLPETTDVEAAVPAAVERAPEIGCSAIVVNQVVGDTRLARELERAGFRRHCDFYAGTLHPV